MESFWDNIVWVAKLIVKVFLAMIALQLISRIFKLGFDIPYASQVVSFLGRSLSQITGGTVPGFLS